MTGGQLPAAALLQRYQDDAALTAGPADALLLLYDRLGYELAAAVAAIGQRDTYAAHVALVAAQAIVRGLRQTLDVAAWPPAEQLAQVYDFVETELIAANLEKSLARLEPCRGIVAALAGAWAQAARSAEAVAASGASDSWVA